MRRITFSILALAMVIGSVGCAQQDRGGKPKPNVVRSYHPPKLPPAPPPRRSVPLDPSLAASARQEITSAFASNDPIVRAHALEAIKDSAGGAEMAASVLTGLTDREPVVRFAATMAAGEMRLEKAKPQLTPLADDQDASVRIGARFALHRLGDTSLSHDLEQTSRSPVDRTRADTALVLGLLGEPSAARILEPMLMDRNPTVRLQAAEALWRLGSGAGLDTLLGATVSRFPDDQMVALLALAASVALGWMPVAPAMEGM